MSLSIAQQETHSIPSVKVDTFEERVLFAFSDKDSALFFLLIVTSFQGWETARGSIRILLSLTIIGWTI